MITEQDWGAMAMAIIWLVVSWMICFVLEYVLLPFGDLITT